MAGAFTLYRLQLGVGSYYLKESGKVPLSKDGLNGFSLLAGHATSLGNHFNFAYQAAFSHSAFSSGSDRLTRNSFGVEVGGELFLHPLLAFGFYGGWNHNFSDSSTGLDIDGRRANFHNTYSSGVSGRLAAMLLGGILTPSFKVGAEMGSAEGEHPGDFPVTANFIPYSFEVFIDPLKTYDALALIPDLHLTRIAESTKSLRDALKWSLFFQSSVSDNFLNPKNGVNTYHANDPTEGLRLNLIKASAELPANSTTPVGGRVAFSLGSDSGAFIPKGSIKFRVAGPADDPTTVEREDTRTLYLGLQEAHMDVYFPALAGLVLKFGQIPAIVCAEVPDGPLNPLGALGGIFFNEPITAGVFLAEQTVFEEKDAADKTTSNFIAKLGIGTGSDGFLVHDSGPTLIAGLDWMISPEHRVVASYLAGPESEGWRHLVDAVYTYKLSTDFTLTADLAVGHKKQPKTLSNEFWEGLAIHMKWAPADWFYVANRVEYIRDPKAVLDSDRHQDLFSETLGVTLQTPLKNIWGELPGLIGAGLEGRIDASVFRREDETGPYFKRDQPSDFNPTIFARIFVQPIPE